MARGVFFVLIALLVTLGVGGFLVIAQNHDFSRSLTPADYGAMLTYRARQLNDEQLRKIHADADAEYQRAVADAKRTGEQFWKRRAELSQQCADIAFRTKNPTDCTMPLRWQEIGTPPLGYESPEVVFERNLMGICSFVETLAKAQKFGCLP